VVHWFHHRTHTAALAPNMTRIVIPTTIRDNHELGGFCLNLRSQAAMRLPPKQKRCEQASRQARLQFDQIFDHPLHPADYKRKAIVIQFVGSVVG
jgi:hypothetical protein